MAKRTAPLPPPPSGGKKKKKSSKKPSADLGSRNRKKAAKKKASSKTAAKKKQTRKKGEPKPKKADVPLTESQCRMAAILDKHPKLSPAEFAKRMWPDSKGWKNETPMGTGPHGNDILYQKGGAMNITAGAALGKFKGAGYATFEIDKEDKRTKRYRLTATGKKALDKSRQAYGV